MKNKLKNILGNGLPFGLVFAGLSFVLGYYVFNISLRNSLLMSSLFGASALLPSLVFQERSTPVLGVVQRFSADAKHQHHDL